MLYGLRPPASVVFWDGSCDNGKRGAGIMVQAFTKTLGRVPNDKECWPAKGQNSLDADLGGCVYAVGKLAFLDRQERVSTTNTNHCCGCVSP